MTSHARARALIVVLTVAAALSPLHSKGADSLTGGGGFPLTPTVTSMWAAVDEPRAPGTKRLTFMVYFRGAAGWHQHKWSFTQQLREDPFVIEFASDLITLRAAVDRASRVLTIFRTKVDLSQSNVLLVEDVDKPGHEIVVPLRHVELDVPEQANPALWLLQRSEAIRSKVLSP
jgi:hypothetical protein